MGATHEGFERFHRGRGAEEAGAGIGAQLLHEAFEGLEGFGLVLVERILLRVGAQADAATEVFHLSQLVLPVAVDGAEEDITFEVLQDRGRFVFLTAGLEGANAVSGEQDHLGLGAGEDVLEVDPHVEGGDEPVDEGVGGATVSFAFRVGEDDIEAGFDLFLDDVHDRLPAIDGLEGTVA